MVFEESRPFPTSHGGYYDDTSDGQRDLDHYGREKWRNEVSSLNCLCVQEIVGNCRLLFHLS